MEKERSKGRWPVKKLAEEKTVAPPKEEEAPKVKTPPKEAKSGKKQAGSACKKSG